MLFRSASALFYAVCGYVWTSAPQVHDPIWLAHEATVNATAFRARIAEAAAWSMAHGADFTDILHPYVWTRPLSPSEELGVKVIRHHDDIGLSYNATYPLLRTPWTVDLSHVLDDIRAQGIEVYVDAYHISWRGDTIMAREIYNVLFPTI